MDGKRRENKLHRGGAMPRGNEKSPEGSSGCCVLPRREKRSSMSMVRICSSEEDGGAATADTLEADADLGALADFLDGVGAGALEEAG